jgi:hypothetical protein
MARQMNRLSGSLSSRRWSSAAAISPLRPLLPSVQIRLSQTIWSNKAMGIISKSLDPVF